MMTRSRRNASIQLGLGVLWMLVGAVFGWWVFERSGWPRDWVYLPAAIVGLGVLSATNGLFTLWLARPAEPLIDDEEESDPPESQVVALWVQAALGAVVVGVGYGIGLGLMRSSAPSDQFVRMLGLVSAGLIWGGIGMLAAATWSLYGRARRLEIRLGWAPPIAGGVAAIAVVAVSALYTQLRIMPELPSLSWAQPGLHLLGVLVMTPAGLLVAATTMAVKLRTSSPTRTLSGNPRAGAERRISRGEFVLLGLLMAVAVGLQLLLLLWYIEDAAISFTYARHIAGGEGAVTWAGGERVEGYSNPLWVALMVVWYWIGVDGFQSSKLMGAAFGAATVPLVFLLAREARPHRRDAVPLLAALLMVFNPQVTIWNASGLENSLFNFLLAAGMLRVLVEGRTPAVRPWSAVIFFALSITRPEGIVYAAFAGFWAMLLTIEARSGGLREAVAGGNGRTIAAAAGRALAPTGAWLALFFVPWCVYQVVHYDYFAHMFANTYYAKRGDKTFNLYTWNNRGWKYARNYAHELWRGYLIPLFVFGLLGNRKTRGLIATVSLLLLGLVLLYPGPDALADTPFWPDLIAPKWWSRARVWVLLGVVGVLPIAAVGRRGWRALVLCWVMAALAVVFTVWSMGDWMKGFRWFSFVSAPAAVLLAVGIGELADAVHHATWRFSRWVHGVVIAVPVLAGLVVCTWLVLPRMGALPRAPRLDVIDLWVMWGIPLALVIGAALAWRHHRDDAHPARWTMLGSALFFGLFATLLLPNTHHLSWFEGVRETGPYKVKKRVDYKKFVIERLGVTDRVVDLDVDMGAHMYWSNYRILDIAGLVDVSMAHHSFQKPFVREYVFEEMQPHLAHVHAGWANTSRIPQHDEWKRDYFELPGYPSGKTSLHVGNFVRKDLFVEPAWSGVEAGVSYAGGVDLVGIELVAPYAAPGRRLFFELGLRTEPREKDEEFRVIAFLASPTGVVHAFDAAPGHDWYPPYRWGPTEVFHGRFSAPLPADLPPAEYDFGVVVLGIDGVPLAAESVHESLVLATGDPEVPRYMRGEVRLVGAVHVVSTDEVDERAAADLAEVQALAGGGDCAAAAEVWVRAQRLQSHRRGWLAEARSGAHVVLADCWAELAAGAARPDAVVLLQRARLLDHWTPRYQAVARPLADDLYEEGLAYREAEQWELAYRAFRDASRVWPWLSWARKYAEETRDRRLGIDPLSLDQADLEREKKRAEDQAAREQRSRDRKARKAAGEPEEPATPKPRLPTPTRLERPADLRRP
jgi:hypothetical protein